MQTNPEPLYIILSTIAVAGWTAAGIYTGNLFANFMALWGAVILLAALSG